MKHGIALSDAGRIFERPLLVLQDNRKDYGEPRWIALGDLNGTVVVLVFTQRSGKIRFISIRKGNAHERQSYQDRAKRRRTGWAKLQKMMDREIDYSDIPATNTKFWQQAQVVIPSAKIHLSLRLDEDIVEWFKRQGTGYQTRINAVLRSYVQAHSTKTKPKAKL